MPPLVRLSALFALGLSELLHLRKSRASDDRQVESPRFVGHGHTDQPDHGTQAPSELREFVFLGEEHVALGHALGLSSQSELAGELPRLDEPRADDVDSLQTRLLQIHLVRREEWSSS